MSGIEELDYLWRTFEGAGGGPDDAAHWVRVYRELLATGEAMLLEMEAAGDAGRVSLLGSRLAVFRSRLRYWEAELPRVPETAL